MLGASKHFRNRTYEGWNHVAIKLNITFARPVDVQVELDTARLGLCHKDIRELQGNVTEILLDEMEGRQRPWKHTFEHGIGDFFHHLAASNIDV